jgi:cell division protease FtsH
MKTPTRHPQIGYQMLPKNLAAWRVMPASAAAHYFAQLHARSEDEEPLPPLEPAFYLGPEDEGMPPSSSYSDGMMAVVGAAFDAAVSPQIRRQIEHAKALAVVIVVPTPAWVAPMSIHFTTTFGSRWHAYDRAGSNRLGGHQMPDASDSVAHNLSRGQCVVGLAADVRLLPAALVAGADITIRVPAPTGAVLRAAIAKFCGSCAVLPDGIAAGLDLFQIVSAFRPGAGPKRVAQRLAAAVTVVRGEVGEE